ncbi:hypothetical protein GWI33_011387 [Rhynchophorus ferrugineus]|uniref:Uncharacterized protein n=1 Tax=Rhynchophorus ferrugineus TaxID=354439 RepID=A0A834IUB2_RHYFE|nr:hypothetical protein GWI33_011387 [Rhynchophorus ferrugineus]
MGFLPKRDGPDNFGNKKSLSTPAEQKKTLGEPLKTGYFTVIMILLCGDRTPYTFIGFGEDPDHGSPAKLLTSSKKRPKKSPMPNEIAELSEAYVPLAFT